MPTSTGKMHKIYGTAVIRHSAIVKVREKARREEGKEKEKRSEPTNCPSLLLRVCQWQWREEEPKQGSHRIGMKI
jgi:hypothetical protein